MERLGMNQIVENSSNPSWQTQCDDAVAHGSSIEEVKEQLEMQLLSTACNILQNSTLDDSEMMAEVQKEIHQYDECRTYLNTLNIQNGQRHR